MICHKIEAENHFENDVNAQRILHLSFIRIIKTIIHLYILNIIIHWRMCMCVCVRPGMFPLNISSHCNVVNIAQRFLSFAIFMQFSSVIFTIS